MEFSRPQSIPTHAAVRRLEWIRSEPGKVQGALDDQKAMQRAHQNWLQEFERTRKNDRRGGDGEHAWGFHSSDMLAVPLGEMLRGAMTRSVFWDNMLRYQRPIIRYLAWLGLAYGAFGSSGKKEKRFPFVNYFIR